MKVTILGSEGQIGAYLSEYLQKKGHEVTGIDVVYGPENDLRVTPNTYVESKIKDADFVFFLAFDVGGSRYLKKYQHTLQHQTPSTDGRNYSPKDCTWLTIVIMGFLFALPVITISLAPKELGTVEERKHQLQSAARLLSQRRKTDLSRCGETVYRLVPSCTLMNALKQLED